MTGRALRGRAACALLALGLAGCGDEEPEPIATGCAVREYAACVRPLDDVEDVQGLIAYTARFPNALARWVSEETCAVVAARGRCADGKRFLYFRSSAGSETRYFGDDDAVIAVVQAGAAACGDACRGQVVFGSLDAARCEAPEVGVLCGGSAVGSATAQVIVPFADGEPLGECVECE